MLRRQWPKKKRRVRAVINLEDKQARLLNLYLDGNLPQASYIVKNSELEAEGRRITEGRHNNLRH